MQAVTRLVTKILVMQSNAEDQRGIFGRFFRLRRFTRVQRMGNSSCSARTSRAEVKNATLNSGLHSICSVEQDCRSRNEFQTSFKDCTSESLIELPFILLDKVKGSGNRQEVRRLSLYCTGRSPLSDFQSSAGGNGLLALGDPSITNNRLASR